MMRAIICFFVTLILSACDYELPPQLVVQLNIFSGGFRLLDSDGKLVIDWRAHECPLYGGDSGSYFNCFVGELLPGTTYFVEFKNAPGYSEPETVQVEFHGIDDEVVIGDYIREP